MRKLLKMLLRWLTETEEKLQDTERYFVEKKQNEEYYKKWEVDR